MSVYVVGQEKDLEPGAHCSITGKVPVDQSLYNSRFRNDLAGQRHPIPRTVKGPRLHDFRHTFAVTTMNRLVDQNNDIYVVLPILSAYLGHSGVKSTERYIRLTEERLSTITDTIGNTLSNIFPEVEDDAEI
jgi:integrase